MITHAIDSYQIPSQNKTKPKLQICQQIKLEFCKNLYTQHTWSCLIRCVNIKWIRLVLWKIQSRHDSVHRQTDVRTDIWTWNRYPFNLVEAEGIIRDAMMLMGHNCNDIFEIYLDQGLRQGIEVEPLRCPHTNYTISHLWWTRYLTHCGLVMPYGNMDLIQHWFR